MAQLVDNDIVDDLDGCHDETPVEVEVFVRRTASTAGLLVAESYAFIGKRVMLIEMLQAVVDDFGCLGFVKFFDGLFCRSHPLGLCDIAMQKNDSGLREIKHTGGKLTDSKLVDCLALELKQMPLSAPATARGRLEYVFSVTQKQSDTR